MRKNKRGKPYQDPLQWVKKCRIKSPDGLIYHATKAPNGLCRCGVMLELRPRKDDFIFSSISRANHAISHTLKFLNELGIDKSIDQFIVEPL